MHIYIYHIGVLIDPFTQSSCGVRHENASRDEEDANCGD
jgi:hypothetical protein